MKKILLIKSLILTLSLTSCANGNAGNQLFSSLMQNPTTSQMVTSALLNNIGIGNISGGLGNSALSKGLFEQVLSQALNQTGYLNNADPRYKLDADISSLANALSGGKSNGAVNYSLIDKQTGKNILSKSISSSTGNESNNPLGSILGLVGGGNNNSQVASALSSANVVNNNATQLLGLLQNFQK